MYAAFLDSDANTKGTMPAVKGSHEVLFLLQVKVV